MASCAPRGNSQGRALASRRRGTVSVDILAARPRTQPIIESPLAMHSMPLDAKRMMADNARTHAALVLRSCLALRAWRRPPDAPGCGSCKKQCGGGDLADRLACTHHGTVRRQRTIGTNMQAKGDLRWHSMIPFPAGASSAA